MKHLILRGAFEHWLTLITLIGLEPTMATASEWANPRCARSAGTVILLILLQACAFDDALKPDVTEKPVESEYSYSLAAIPICTGIPVKPMPPVSSASGYITIQGIELLTAPVNNACVSSGFGKRNGKDHEGVDYANKNGGPIFSAGDGKVLNSRHSDSYGNVLLIRHSAAVYTQYAHLLRSDVSVGDTIKQGQVIGWMGSTGRASGVHLHYELLVKSQSDGSDNTVFNVEDPLQMMFEQMAQIQ